jgi:ubiquinone/menaquinone biosynthesis C-methylase UbiE
LGEPSSIDWKKLDRKSLREQLAEGDDTFRRAFYEAHGERVLAEFEEIACSSPQIYEVVERMIDELPAPASRALDVGCGCTASYNYHLASTGAEVVGAEYAFSFCQLAKIHAANSGASIRLVQADGTRLPFKDSSFDLVVSSETIEHIPDDRAVISEIARVLVPGGRLLLTVPNLWNASRIFRMIYRRTLDLDLLPGHLREYSPSQVRDLLSDSFEELRFFPVVCSFSDRWYYRLTNRLIRSGWMQRFSLSLACSAKRRS